MLACSKLSLWTYPCGREVAGQYRSVRQNDIGHESSKAKQTTSVGAGSGQQIEVATATSLWAVSPMVAVAKSRFINSVSSFTTANCQPRSLWSCTAVTTLRALIRAICLQAQMLTTSRTWLLRGEADTDRRHIALRAILTTKPTRGCIKVAATARPAGWSASCPGRLPTPKPSSTQTTPITLPFWLGAACGFVLGVALVCLWASVGGE